MTDFASVSQDPGPLPGDMPEKDVRGRSLFQLALLRLRRNRAAMTGFVVLALVTIFCFAGPHFVTQRYDQVFASYVGVAPSLEPRPSEDVLEGVAGTVAARARLDLVAFETENGIYRATVRNEDEPVDPRVTRFFDRANEFSGGAGAAIVETEDEGRTAIIEGTVGQQYFLMGTDRNGRDLMVRVMIGGQISLIIGILASLVALVIGVTYGAIAGYVGGRVDNIMMRLVEILYSLPFVFLVIMLVVFFGRSFILIFLVIGMVEWLDMARIVRGQTLSIKRREFVAAAEAMGVTDRQIIWRHVVPNTIGPVVVFVTIVVPKVILLESFLSFLGLGVQAPLTSWGALIADGAQTLQAAPWLLVFPAIFFCVTLFALNFIGDGLRDAFDPKDR